MKKSGCYNTEKVAGTDRLHGMLKTAARERISRYQPIRLEYLPAYQQQQQYMDIRFRGMLAS